MNVTAMSYLPDVVPSLAAPAEALAFALQAELVTVRRAYQYQVTDPHCEDGILYCHAAAAFSPGSVGVVEVLYDLESDEIELIPTAFYAMDDEGVQSQDQIAFAPPQIEDSSLSLPPVRLGELAQHIDNIMRVIHGRFIERVLPAGTANNDEQARRIAEEFMVFAQSRLQLMNTNQGLEQC